MAAEVIAPSDLSVTQIQVLCSQLGGGGNFRAAIYNWVANGPATLIAQSNVQAVALGLRTLTFASPVSLTANSRYYLAVGTTSNGMQLAAFQSGTVLDGQSTAFAVRDVNNFAGGNFPASFNTGSPDQFVPWMRAK